MAVSLYKSRRDGPGRQLTHFAGNRSSSEEIRDPEGDDTTVVEPEQGNGTAIAFI